MYSRQNTHAPLPKLEDASLPPPPVPNNSNSALAMNQMPPVHGQQMYAPAPAPGDHLRPFQGEKNGRIYKLSVEQQPVRARMCGFGDKDRRPITPPPCIRLIVCDAATGKEIDFPDVDSTFFVLTVDLWDADGQREVNLVRHSSGAPTVSISSSTTTSYPPPVERPAVYMTSMMPQYDSYGRPVAAPQPYGAPPLGGAYYSNPAAPNYPYNAQPYGAAQPQMAMPVAAPPSTATGMFTRNLIGSLTVNAFRLTDTDSRPGFWFVLQDLSVRTEGVFRLKMNFVDVGSGHGNNTLNTGRAPVLATCFSDQFQVYSAKKFPGVIESTPLSKAFAQQGIKIPIRKDGPKTLSNQAEYDADE
ncbi:velvet factor-domain-containing protein [Lophiotrema nucula]|uniref:Velvet factor-domain-containing protein n=1 Tax=Lophiotrema nucula TaxID=690887 RepID=A0A6A5YQ57_9PLEO|nr:velvet factor-domain-containing protein [Lophiotrema nucula]